MEVHLFIKSYKTHEVLIKRHFARCTSYPLSMTHKAWREVEAAASFSFTSKVKIENK